MFIHVVQKGESLFEIAKKYGVDINKVANDNELDISKTLVVGQALIIRKDNFIYQVQANDSLYKIASKTGLPVQKIMEDNDLKDPGLVVGQELNIYYDNQNKVKMEINGYVYPDIDLEVLRKTLPHLTYVSIFSYQFNADGTLRNINDEMIISEAYKYNVAPIMVICNIDKPGEFSSELVHKILIDPALQDVFLNNILNNLKKKGYYGIDFDFEYLYPEDRENYNNFLKKATAFFHNRNYKVSSAIAPKLSDDQVGILYEAHDYQAHGATVDRVIIMTYEWGYIWSEAMAVAPINMVEKVISYAVTKIPPKKILMGMPNYGYDFNAPKIEGIPAKLISNLEAIDIARREKAEIKFNEISASPYFTYYDEKKQQHEVHFEDARSIIEKIELAIDYKLGGLSYWTLMSYFNQNWLVVDYLIDVVKVIGSEEVEKRLY